VGLEVAAKRIKGCHCMSFRLLYQIDDMSLVLGECLAKVDLLEREGFFFRENLRSRLIAKLILM